MGYTYIYYFLGLSFRDTSKALSPFVERSHVSIWKWVQNYKPERISFKRKKYQNLQLMKHTQIKVGQDYSRDLGYY